MAKSSALLNVILNKDEYLNGRDYRHITDFETESGSDKDYDGQNGVWCRASNPVLEIGQ